MTEHGEGVHGLVEGVGEDGGAAGQPLLGNQIARAQGLLQQAGPALVFVEADPAVGAVGRVGAVAVGIGVAKAEDMFFHSWSRPFRFGMIWGMPHILLDYQKKIVCQGK